MGLVKPSFLTSYSNPPPVFINCSGLMMTAWYCRSSIACQRCHTVSFKRYQLTIDTYPKVFGSCCTCVSALMKIAFNPALLSDSTFNILLSQKCPMWLFRKAKGFDDSVTERLGP
jgi:hypothetical protein